MVSEHNSEPGPQELPVDYKQAVKVNKMGY